jgi:hypothetical protein
MRRPLLNAFALMSMIALVVLVCGYIAQFGPVFRYNVFGGARPHSAIVRIDLDFGRVRILLEDVNIPPAGGTPEGLQAYLPSPRFGLPDVRRSIWEFDGHYLTATKAGSIFIVAFPIWMVGALFLIAPLLWFRKRPTPQLSAFPVVMAAGHASRAGPLSPNAE